MAKSRGSTAKRLTRYQALSDDVVGELRVAHRRGDDLRRVVPWLSMESKRVAIAEAAHADRLTRSEGSLAADDELPETDYGRAVVAERLLPEDAPDLRLHAEAQALLEQIGTSSAASPLLDYEPLYRDLAEARLLDADRRSIDWLLRALAHNLTFHRGDDAAYIAVDVASALLQLGDLDQGLAVLTRVATRPEAGLWVCRFMATGFGVLGLVDLGLKGTRCGLRLLDELGDPEELRDDFLMAQFELLSSPVRGREADADPAIVGALERALDASDGRSPTVERDLAIEDVLPDLRTTPVKRVMRFSDLPEPVQRLLPSVRP